MRNAAFASPETRSPAPVRAHVLGETPPAPKVGRPIPAGIRPLFSTARVRITSIKDTHPVGRMALAIIRLRDDGHTVIQKAHLALDFSAGEVERHWREACELARAFQPATFANMPNWGA